MKSREQTDQKANHKRVVGLFQKEKEGKQMYLIKNGVVHVGDGTILKDCDILTKGSTIQKIRPGT